MARQTPNNSRGFLCLGSDSVCPTVVGMGLRCDSQVVSRTRAARARDSGELTALYRDTKIFRGSIQGRWNR